MSGRRYRFDARARQRDDLRMHEIARYREDPEALRQRLHELTSNPARQALLLKEVRGEQAVG